MSQLTENPLARLRAVLVQHDSLVLAVSGGVDSMTLAHAATMSGVDGITMQGEQIAHGARLTVTGPDADMIRGLGFIGILTLGMHHQAHHIALARGTDPHQD